MTCGICEPQLFRPATGGRVFGYAVAHDATSDARALHYQGCEFVFADRPVGKVANRENFKRLRRCLRKGDRLIVTNLKTLGKHPNSQQRQIEAFEAVGVDVFTLTANGKAALS